ncbi:MAG: glycosyltransferase family 2 protein [Paracoccaceae bacterium]
MVASKKIECSVVCPLYNEETLISQNFSKLYNLLEAQFNDSFELILVNDGSKDDSINRLLKSIKDEKINKGRVRVFSYDYNQGRGRALKTGIDNANGNIIVTTESDMSWGKSIISELYKKLDDDPQLHFVIASPHLKKGSFKNVPLGRRLLSKYGNKLIKTFFIKEISMNTGMTRAYRSEVIKPLLVERDGKDFHLEVLLKLLGLGFKYAEIPATLSWPEKDQNKSNVGAKRKSSTNILNTIFSHLTFIVYARPIKQFALITASTFLMATIFLGLSLKALYDGDEHIFHLGISILLYLGTVMFAAFCIQFFQTRDLLRSIWMANYAMPHPPSRVTGECIYDSLGSK